MAEGSELLRRYIEALLDPTRGMILMELAHGGELTPTQLARRLGLTANNVYHHMRVLRELGVVDPPRAAPRETYVEKYYHVTPELAALTGGDPYWADRAQAAMSFADRKALLISLYLTVARLLTRAAQRYEAMDDETFDEVMLRREMGMVSINNMSRSRLARRLAALRETIRQEGEAGALEGAEPDAEPERDMVIMASLPLMWDDEEER